MNDIRVRSINGRIITRKNRSTQRNPLPVSFYLLSFRQGLAFSVNKNEFFYLHRIPLLFFVYQFYPIPQDSTTFIMGVFCNFIFRFVTYNIFLIISSHQSSLLKSQNIGPALSPPLPGSNKYFSISSCFMRSCPCSHCRFWKHVSLCCQKYLPHGDFVFHWSSAIFSR